MYPTFSYFLADFFGINIPLPIQTFGLFMGIAFVVAAWVWCKELTRLSQIHKFENSFREVITGKPATFTDLLGNSLVGFILGFKLIFIVFNYSLFVSNPPEILLSTTGSIWGGILLSIIFAYLKYSKSKKEELQTPKKEVVLITPSEHVANMTFIAAIFGILGAKIFHNLENINEFIADPINSLLSFSGLTWYGGLIVATIALYFYSKKHKLYFPYLMDSSAPALMIGYAIGRFGCHFSGDGDWGIVNNFTKPSWLGFAPDWFWAYKYPHNVINEGVQIAGCFGDHCMQLANPVFPTPLYEALACTIMFFILWNIKSQIRVTGILFSIYLMFNGAERFAIELIRVNTTYNFWGGVTQAQIISTLLFFCGLGSTVYLIFNTKKSK